MPDIASVFWVNLPVSSINTRITRVTHESDTHCRIRPCDILLYHKYSKYSRYIKYSRYSRLQSRVLRKNGHCRERKKPSGAPFLLRLHPGTLLTPAAWRTGIRRAQNAAGDSFCSSEGDQAMHAGTKKRTGWNRVAGSSPFGKMQNRSAFFKKQHEKTGEISRNLPFLVLFGLNRTYGRGRRDRTLGLRFWRPPLYQLSYTPVSKRRLPPGQTEADRTLYIIHRQIPVVKRVRPFFFGKKSGRNLVNSAAL